MDAERTPNALGMELFSSVDAHQVQAVRQISSAQQVGKYGLLTF